MADILVLNGDMHGIPASECAASLRERVPDHDITLARTEAEGLERIADAEIVVGGAFPDEYLERAENLRLFACAWAGVGHIDLEEFNDRGIAVTNASGVHGPNMAEHVIGWFLMIARRLDEGLRRQERHEWRHFQAFDEFRGSRVCVVGLGAIGHAIVERLDGFGVETVGVRYSPEKGGPTDEVFGFAEIDDAFVDTSYVAIACPLSEETRGLVGRSELAALPTDAVIANVGRGPIIDTDALVAALQGNKIHAAALDVTDPEPLPPDHVLWDLGNVYITPHNSGHTPYYWDRVADILIRNLEVIEETGRYENLENQMV